MTLNEQLRDLERRFDERSMAEKLLISVLVPGILIWLFASLFLSDVSADISGLERQLANTQVQLSAMQQREQQAQRASVEDPNQAVRVRIERATAELERLQVDIEQLTGNLVTPQTMTRSLTSILERQPGLTLIRVENRPPQAMRVLEETAAEAEQQPQVYRHTMVLELEGDYLHLIAYLQRIENLPERFFWDQISFVQTIWPDARITLELHTLSAEEGFVGV